MMADVIGGLAGVALARRGGGWVKPFLLIVFLILVTPEIVDAIGYLIWFVRLGDTFIGAPHPQNELPRSTPASSGCGSAIRCSRRRW